MPTGYVYIMTNPMYPDLLKIGHTTLQVSERAADLSRATGVLQPFVIEYWRLTLKAKDVERIVHDAFAAQRENKRREFFRVSIDEAIREIERHIQDPTTHFRRTLPRKVEASANTKRSGDTATYKGRCANCSRSIQVEIPRDADFVACPFCRRKIELTNFLRKRHFGL